MLKHLTQLKRADGLTSGQFISAREILPKPSMPTCKHSMPNQCTSRQPSNAACFAMKSVTSSAILRPQGRLLTQIQRTKSATNSWRFSLDLQRVKQTFSRHHRDCHPPFPKDLKWPKKHSTYLARADHNFMLGLIPQPTTMSKRLPCGAPSSKMTGRTLTIGVDSLVPSKTQVT